MVRARVGILRGGTSREYEASLATGGAVLRHLPSIYRGYDILIDRAGVWHFNGLPMAPGRIARQVDVFWNALHGEYDKKGKARGAFDQLGVSYTGSGVVASALGRNKIMAKEIFRRAGLRVLPEVIFKVASESPFIAESAAQQVFNKISPPWIVKPADRGSPVELFLAKTFKQLVAALAAIKKFSRSILVEPYLCGRKATCGVVDNFRRQDVYALPPIETRLPAEEICPANFKDAEKREIERLAVAAHQVLGLRHYSSSNFILTGQGIYLLKTNNSPELAGKSLFPKALAAIGCPYPHFLDHVLSLALAGR